MSPAPISTTETGGGAAIGAELEVVLVSGDLILDTVVWPGLAIASTGKVLIEGFVESMSAWESHAARNKTDTARTATGALFMSRKLAIPRPSQWLCQCYQVK